MKAKTKQKNFTFKGYDITLSIESQVDHDIVQQLIIIGHKHPVMQENKAFLAIRKAWHDWVNSETDRENLL